MTAGAALAGGLALLVGAVGAAWLRSGRYRWDGDVVHVPVNPAWIPAICVIGVIGAAPVFPPHPAPVVGVYVASWCVAVTLVVVDLQVRRIPDSVTLPAYPILTAAFLGCAAAAGTWSALVRAVTCAGAAAGIFVLLALLSPGAAGLGLGDVKLAGLLGMLLGWSSWWQPVVGLALALVLGAAFGVVAVVLGRRGRRSTIPFGPFLVASAYLIGVLPATV